MPTIAGIVQLNNEATIGNHGFELMKAINIQSSDEAIIWQQKQIFLGCVVSKLGENLPYVDEKRRMAITAHVHLDNRDELFDRLGIEEIERKTIQDGQLILLAYQKWERDCPNFLVGEFVFVIWDDSEEMLFGAMSYEREEPLYYYQNEEAFAFCTSIAPLLALPYVESGLNERWFAVYTNDSELGEDYDIAPSITPYEQIKQIPPGYMITLRQNQLEISLYAVYTIWDNRRFIVVEEEIVIDNLPEQLKGFRILQISDLHEKWFGGNQTDLIAAINAIDYDAIVFTGDMLDSTESENYEPFYSLIDRITNKKNAWFVPGNTDPDSYEVEQDVKKSVFINGMEARGVQLLESVDKVSVDGANVYFTNFELSIIKNPEYLGIINGIVQPDYVSTELYLDYQQRLWDEMNVLDKIQPTDLVIALSHYPVPDVRVNSIKESPGMEWRDYDLIMAGHYHGGQIRLPILGAFFIPEPWYEPNSFFPPRDRVKGLWNYEGTKQYVSAGLGSSDAILFLKFRFLNPPEINVLSFR
uniref:Calcineurin-like phosphoesterase domain-containing protein n=1 Tax=Batrachochytrium dendrobatidis (strain JAM81 / FGSC 10211) TaxID=684364 RepID=F4PFK2_BATDJ|eukprot:XP_006683385.1 hypothetical protein BATDEDRAFT_93151 [Batrachochytrium dendrobatidis JAM81]